jgi:hypothetical protein
MIDNRKFSVDQMFYNAAGENFYPSFKDSSEPDLETRRLKTSLFHDTTFSFADIDHASHVAALNRYIACLSEDLPFAALMLTAEASTLIKGLKAPQGTEDSYWGDDQAVFDFITASQKKITDSNMTPPVPTPPPKPHP